MIASFSVLAHRKRQLSPPKRLASKVAGLRFWRPLNVGGDFAWFRQHPNRRALYPRLRPAFRRWAYYAVWDDECAFEEFLTGSLIGRAWAEESAEAWHVWLAPVRVRGDWEGIRPLRGAETTGRDGAPAAHLVRLDLSLRATAAMWGSAAPNLLRHIPDCDDLLAGIPLVDRPYMQPVSFSVWRSEDAATRFEYGDGHRAAVSRVQRSQADLLQHYSAGRFDPYRSQGTWNGRNPLADASHAADALPA
jgi:hypothetical protein